MINTSTTDSKTSLNRKTPPTIIIIFGASGDLTARKLAPAIFSLSKDNLLPKKCFLIGYGRSAISDESFKNDNTMISVVGGGDELHYNGVDETFCHCSIFFIL